MMKHCASQQISPAGACCYCSTVKAKIARADQFAHTRRGAAKLPCDFFVWIINGHSATSASCPFYPRKRRFESDLENSANGYFRTNCVAATNSLSPLLTLPSSFRHIATVGPYCSRPAYPRHIAQALQLARSPGRGLLAICLISTKPFVCWRRWNPGFRRPPGKLLRAAKRCLTPKGDEKCLAMTQLTAPLSLTSGCIAAPR
jgi:hypothetical protein